MNAKLKNAIVKYLTCAAGIFVVLAISNVVQGAESLVDTPAKQRGRTWQSEAPKDCPFEVSKSLTGISFTGRHAEYTTADTWYPSWGSDDRLYSPFTDGAVNGVSSWSFGNGPRVGHAIIEGNDPLKLQVIEPNIIRGNPEPYEGRYPCGSLMYNDVWYIATYALANAPYGLNWPIQGPCAGFHISKDKGKTWIPSPRSCALGNTLIPEPAEFKGPVKFGAPHFVDFGKNMQHSPDGKAYLIGHGSTEKDLEDRKANLSWITADEIYLCRVKPSIETINDSSQYEYFGGSDTNGKPVWTKDFSKIKPLLSWDNNMGCVTATFIPALNKYLMCVTDGGTTMSKFNTYILEADRITGPYRLVTYMKSFGEQAYFVNIPSKFISSDGRSMWLCYSANFTNGYAGTYWHSLPPGSNYHMCLQEIKLLGSEDKPDPSPLASPANIAPRAQVTVSSTHPDYSQFALVDGMVDGYPNDISCEWASNAEKDTAMARLSWSEEHTVDKVWLFDRPNDDYDRVLEGLLVFPDGSTIKFGQLPDDAKQGLEVTFEPKKITWLAVIISKVKPSTLNIGFSEIAVFRTDEKSGR